MLRDIESGKDNVSFVLVFKLSRFGRNAADVLTSLQWMQDYGVNLICVEDGIDSSKDSGKLMISVLSAAAEIQRENILVQTMEGRRQKAREDVGTVALLPKQWSEDIVNYAVADVIRRLVQNPKFEEAIREKIGSQIDTVELEQELDMLRKQLRQLNGTKDRLGQQIDHLDFDDPHYDRKYQDLQERQNTIYDNIAAIEVDIADVQVRLNNVRQQKISGDNVYQSFSILTNSMIDSPMLRKRSS